MEGNLEGVVSKVKGLLSERLGVRQHAAGRRMEDMGGLLGAQARCWE